MWRSDTDTFETSSPSDASSVHMHADGSLFLHNAYVKMCLSWLVMVLYSDCVENSDMAAPPPTVFLCYRRNVSSFIARAVFLICASTDMTCLWTWRALIAGNSRRSSRPDCGSGALPGDPGHGTLEGCEEPDDWLRREIEYAIKLGRNVVPILVNNFASTIILVPA